MRSERTIERATQHARTWYPLGEIHVTRASDSEATIIVTYEGSTYPIHYVYLEPEELVTHI